MGLIFADESRRFLRGVRFVTMGHIRTIKLPCRNSVSVVVHPCRKGVVKMSAIPSSSPSPRDWKKIAAELSTEQNTDRVIHLAHELNEAIASDERTISEKKVSERE